MAKRPKTTSAEQVIETTVGILPAGTTVRPTYSHGAAVKQYASWVYAAARMNAQAVAAQSLRLYTYNGSETNQERLYRTRKVNNSRRKYILGELQRKPHPTVVSKAMEFGDDFEEVVAHPAAALLRKVNPWQGGHELLTLLGLYLELTGNAYWYTERSGIGNTPSMILSLMPKMVEVIPDSGSMIAGYVYGRSSESPVTLTTDEVLHFKYPNPDSLWYGRGKVESAWNVICQNNAIHEMDFAFFSNFARPDMLVTIQASSDKKAIDRFREEISQKNGGTKKSGRLLAVTGAVDVKPLAFPPKDLSGRDEVVEEIAACFGVPVTMLKANDPNLASAEAGYASWREMTISPMCKTIEDVLNQIYLPMWGLEDQAVFAFDDPVPSNRDFALREMTEKVSRGIWSINEARELDGQDEHDNPLADELLVNGQPIGASMAMTLPPIDRISPQPEPDEEDEDELEDEPIIEQRSAKNRTKAVDKSPSEECVSRKIRILLDEGYSQDQAVAIAYSMCDEESKRADKPNGESTCGCGCGDKSNGQPISQKDLWLGNHRIECGDYYKETPLDELEERRVAAFVAGINEVMRMQSEASIAVLQRSSVGGSAAVEAAIREIADGVWVSEIRDVADPFIRDALRQGGTAGMGRIGVDVSFDLANPEVQRFVDRASTRLAIGMNQTTEIRMRSLLGDGLTQGETIPQLSERIRTSTGFEPARAETIARTESARAYVQGQEEAWKQSGVVEGKQWLLAPDACEFCRAAAREFSTKTVPLGQPFFARGSTLAGVAGGTMRLDYDDVQGAPLHPNCRCDVVPVVKP
jgi:HK97 family phage portal protein